MAKGREKIALAKQIINYCGRIHEMDDNEFRGEYTANNKFKISYRGGATIVHPLNEVTLSHDTIKIKYTRIIGKFDGEKPLVSIIGSLLGTLAHNETANEKTILWNSVTGISRIK